jgi:IS30 family transposase
MNRKPRIYYTESQKALMWEHWQKGDSLQQIAQLFDRNHSSIERILAETGGIRPVPRRRSRLALTLAEREEISRAIATGESIRSIAKSLGRAPSTISREINRNGGDEQYRAAQAEQAAWERARRPKTCSQIATLVERQTRYVMLVKVAGKDTQTVIDALIKHAGKLPEELYQSLMWDRGKEMADHKRFTLATDIQVYFCDPQHPWQRGSNENTNGLLRQYFPKGIDLSSYTQAKLNAIARQLNERPRKTLNYETPAQRFHQSVASTG